MWWLYILIFSFNCIANPLYELDDSTPSTIEVSGVLHPSPNVMINDVFDTEIIENWSNIVKLKNLLSKANIRYKLVEGLQRQIIEQHQSKIRDRIHNLQVDEVMLDYNLNNLSEVNKKNIVKLIDQYESRSERYLKEKNEALAKSAICQGDTLVISDSKKELNIKIYNQVDKKKEISDKNISIPANDDVAVNSLGAEIGDIISLKGKDWTVIEIIKDNYRIRNK